MVELPNGWKLKETRPGPDGMMYITLVAPSPILGAESIGGLVRQDDYVTWKGLEDPLDLEMDVDELDRIRKNELSKKECRELRRIYEDLAMAYLNARTAGDEETDRKLKEQVEKARDDYMRCVKGV